MKKIIHSCKYAMLGLPLVLSSCSFTDKPAEQTQVAPNVLFILVDDLGYADIGAYNPDSFYDTPNVDQLSKEGIRFTNGYAANPVCSPSRYAALTGKHPTRADATEWFHINNWPERVETFKPAKYKDYLPHEEVTLAEAFKQQGYKTAFLGKWHLGAEQEYWPEKHGFDKNIGGNKYGQPPGGYFSPYNNPRLSDGENGEYLTQRLTSEAVGLLDEYAKQDSPFFMYLSFYSVHTPLEAPQSTVDKYKKKSTLVNSSNSFTEEEQIWPTDEKRLVRVKQNHPTYAAMVNHMDTNVGRLLNKLKETGLDKNTIIVFTSDNGGLSTSEGSPTSNLPLRGGKGWLYEGGVRVPFIVKVPNAKSNGSTVDSPVVSTDLYPTLLSSANLPLIPTQHKDGVSLHQLIEGKSQSQQLNQRPIFFHYPHYSNQGGFPGAAVRLGDWKLIERFEDGQVHLYDLTRDKAEQNDLAQTKPAKVKAMKAMLHQWYKETDAQFLRANNGQAPWLPK